MMEQDEYLEFSVKDPDKDLEYFLMVRHGSPRLQEIRELTNTSLIEAVDGHFGMIGAVVRKVGDARRSQWEIDTLKGMDEVIVHEESDVRYAFFVAGDEFETSELEHDVQKRKHYIQSTILGLYDGITVEVRPINNDT